MGKRPSTDLRTGQKIQTQQNSWKLPRMNRTRAAPQQPFIVQSPLQVPTAPPAQSTVHGSLPPQVTLQVVPLSAHVTLQPPPEH
jgi:hypothetical protein